MFHLAGLFFGYLWVDPYFDHEEFREHLVTLEHRLTVFIAFGSERDIAIEGLIEKPLGFEARDGL